MFAQRLQACRSFPVCQGVLGDNNSHLGFPAQYSLFSTGFSRKVLSILAEIYKQEGLR